MVIAWATIETKVELPQKYPFEAIARRPNKKIYFFNANLRLFQTIRSTAIPAIRIEAAKHMQL
jgi:hypothetical protein